MANSNIFSSKNIEFLLMSKRTVIPSPIRLFSIKSKLPPIRFKYLNVCLLLPLWRILFILWLTFIWWLVVVHTLFLSILKSRRSGSVSFLIIIMIVIFLILHFYNFSNFIYSNIILWQMCVWQASWSRAIFFLNSNRLLKKNVFF